MTPRDSNQPPANMSPHFLKREADGSVRVRLRLSPEEARLIEEGAGGTPVMLYIHRVLKDRAQYHIKKRAEAEQAARAARDAAGVPLTKREVEA